MIGYLFVALLSVSTTYAASSTYCSAPPASLEVCLSSVFSEIETGLSAIAKTLVGYEASIKSEMHHEHTLLHEEVSWVALVESIAESVKSAVDLDYHAVYIQIQNLLQEKLDIHYAYLEAYEYLKDIEVQINEVESEEKHIEAEYEKVKGEKWSLYSAISAIVQEKIVISEEQAEISKVIAKLHEEMSVIYSKVSQLNKRQSWLVSWEDKLSVDVKALQSDIVEFRKVEVDLYNREVSLYAEQAALLIKVNDAESCIESLEVQYNLVQKQLQYIYAYEYRLKKVQESVSEEAKVFISAYEEFTCEDSLLYHLACSDSVKAVASVPAVAAP